MLDVAQEAKLKLEQAALLERLDHYDFHHVHDCGSMRYYYNQSQFYCEWRLGLIGLDIFMPLIRRSLPSSTFDCPIRDHV